MPSLRIAAVAVAAVLGLGAMSINASAMPVNGLTSVPAQSASSGLQEVRWVCGPYRCWWRPGPAYWGPRPYWHRGWGWRRW
jgi:hypothetical protein